VNTPVHRHRLLI